MFEIRIDVRNQNREFHFTYTEQILNKNNWKIDMVCSKSERLFGNSNMMFGNRKRMFKNLLTYLPTVTE